MTNKVRHIGRATHQGFRQSQEAKTRAEFEETLQETAKKQAAPRRSSAPSSARARTPRRSGGMSMLHAQRLAHWAPLIKYNAQKYGIPVELLCGVMLQESGGNPRAKSHCGATGLMQLMPATARRLGVTQIWDPGQNIAGGAKYLGMLLKMFHGNAQLAIAGYNAGEGAVKKYGGIPPYRETQNYVPSVISHVQTVSGILRGQPGMIRPMIRSTMPRHAIANFSPIIAPRPQPQKTLSTEAVAHRLVRL